MEWTEQQGLVLRGERKREGVEKRDNEQGDRARERENEKKRKIERRRV